MPAAAAARKQTALKSFAGGLAFVCLVLFLLAIEQRHTVAAWQAVRDEALPAASRLIDAGVRRTGLAAEPGVAPAPAQAAAQVQGPPTALVGEFGPADADTRETVGALTFVAANLAFERGESLRTRPRRIAAAGEAFTPGQTYAARLGVAAGAQVELRDVIPARRGGAVSPSPLCGGQAPAVVALLHRGRRVDLMLFRAAPGPDAPPSAVCGVWSFTAR